MMSAPIGSQDKRFNGYTFLKSIEQRPQWVSTGRDVRLSGYDAMPLKRLFVPKGGPDPYRQQLNQAIRHQFAQPEGLDQIEVVGANQAEQEQISRHWFQDAMCWVIHPKTNQLQLLTSPSRLLQFFKSQSEIVISKLRWNQILQRVAEQHQATPVDPEAIVEGGDYFLGRDQTGQPYFMWGAESMMMTWGIQSRNGQLPNTLEEAYPLMKAQLSRTYHIPPDRIFLVPSPAFHLDMMMRPIGKGTVLIHDDQESANMLNEALAYYEDQPAQDPTGRYRQELKQLMDTSMLYRQRLEQECYHDADDIESTMNEQIKLNWVRMPMVFGITNEYAKEHSLNGAFTINYANAVVHQRPDGGLVYMTNASHIPKLNELFEQRLKERSAGRVKSVVFIEGGRHPDTGLTHTEHLLTFSNGGVKCYVSEQPAEAVMAQAV